MKALVVAVRGEPLPACQHRRGSDDGASEDTEGRRRCGRRLPDGEGALVFVDGRDPRPYRRRLRMGRHVSDLTLEPRRVHDVVRIHSRDERAASPIDDLVEARGEVTMPAVADEPNARIVEEGASDLDRAIPRAV